MLYIKGGKMKENILQSLFLRYCDLSYLFTIDVQSYCCV